MNCMSSDPVLGNDVEESWILVCINKDINNSIVHHGKKTKVRSNSTMKQTHTPLYIHDRLCRNRNF